jgi:DNA-directed RNA polymerase subunit RPC12/RpoP
MSVYKKKKTGFEDVPGFTKRVKCAICKRLIKVENMNQLKCDKCGYRGKNKEYEEKDDEKRAEINAGNGHN